MAAFYLRARTCRSGSFRLRHNRCYASVNWQNRLTLGTGRPARRPLVDVFALASVSALIALVCPRRAGRRWKRSRLRVYRCPLRPAPPGRSRRDTTRRRTWARIRTRWTLSGWTRRCSHLELRGPLAGGGHGLVYFGRLSERCGTRIGNAHSALPCVRGAWPDARHVRGARGPARPCRRDQGSPTTTDSRTSTTRCIHRSVVARVVKTLPFTGQYALEGRNLLDNGTVQSALRRDICLDE